MQLQSQVSRKYGDTEYLKNWIVVPNELIKELKWKKGQRLKAEIKEGKLVLEKD